MLVTMKKFFSKNIQAVCGAFVLRAAQNSPGSNLIYL